MLENIEQQLPAFSPAEQRVANWVLAHPRQTAGSTLAVVADACGTSEPTVIRFCRRLGLGGFRELALRLTEASSQPGSLVHRAVSADDTMTDAVTKVIDASIQSLVDLRALLTAMPIAAAVAAMESARSMVFAGLGASGQVARDASHKFFRLGIPCSAVTDTPGILQFAAIATPGDVFIITSHSGRWPALAHAAQRARQRGACVIAITDPNCVLAKHASIVFPSKAPEDTSVFTPMSSRLAQLALFDAIQVALALSMGDVAADRLERTKLALREFPAA